MKVAYLQLHCHSILRFQDRDRRAVTKPRLSELRIACLCKVLLKAFSEDFHMPVKSTGLTLKRKSSKSSKQQSSSEGNVWGCTLETKTWYIT